MEAASMIVLGLILILLAAGAAVFSAIASGSTTQKVEMEALGVIVVATPLALYIAGVASLLLLVLGLLMVSRGTKRRAHSRRELKELRKHQAAQPTPADDGQHEVRHGRDDHGRVAPGEERLAPGASGRPLASGATRAETTEGGGRGDAGAGSSGKEPPKPR